MTLTRPLYPRLEPLPKAGRYVLVEPFEFTCAGVWWRLAPGYSYDGASVPSYIGLTWAMTYAKHDPRVMTAALVHDVLCEVKPNGTSSIMAADTFYALLLRDGASKLKAKAMWTAVKWGGPTWDYANRLYNEHSRFLSRIADP